MRKLGQKRLLLNLREPITQIPAGLEGYELSLSDDGHVLTYAFDAHADETGIAQLLKKLGEVGVDFKDLQTEQNSLEDIFVSLVHQ
jgi:ABC-2 type transport system ATP-binding protein